jgi:transketolase
MISAEQLSELKDTSLRMRYELIKMMGFGKVHHFGGSLSVVEIMTALYFYKMRIRSDDPEWYERDRFVMSKGHSVPAQYVALALKGIIPMESLKTLKALGSILQGHPNSWMTPGIEACTGSLGQGLSFGNGVALCAKIKKIDSRVYVVMGDGELHEGQVWEAALTSSTQKLDNLVAFIDRNSLKSQGLTDEAKSLEPLKEKWDSFGWHTVVIDGHDLKAICDALDEAETIKGKPTMIIAKTIKGKGISFIEGKYEFHNSSITEEQYKVAIKEVALEDCE